MIFNQNNLKVCLAAPQEIYTQWRDEQPDGFRTVSLSMAGPTDVPIYTAVMVKYDRPFRGRSYSLLSRAELDAKINELLLAERPLYPYILTATGPSSAPLYAVCFREMDVMPLAAPNLSADQYRAETELQRDLGNILLWVDCFGTGGSVRYCAVWGANEKGEAWNAEAIDDKNPERQERFDALDTIGARPALVAMNHNGGLARMFVDSRLLRSHSSRSNMRPNEMQGEMQTQQASRRYPIRIGTAVVNKEVRYSAIFAEGDELMGRTFQKRGPPPVGLAPADQTKAADLDAWMETYVKAHRLRGAALAVVEGTRLVYTKAYTYAEADYPLIEPTSLFRMASVSKTFVAIAVWKLLADTDWSRKSSMQEILQLKQPDGSDPADSDFGAITVRHLLESCSGIDQGSVRDAVKDVIADNGDPKRNQPLTQAEIAQIIAAKPLVGTPGAIAEYGSTDYFLLGLIAAKIAGTTDFEGALKQKVLDPLRMTRTVGSRSRLETQPAGHVRQHAKGLATGKSAIHDDRRLVPVQYGHENYEVYDGAGGVSAAIVDLARLCAMLSCRSDNNPLMEDDVLIEMLDDGVAASDKYGSHGFHGFDWVKSKPDDHFQLEKGGTNPGVRAGFTGRTDRRIYIVARNGEPWPLAMPTDWKTEIATRADAVNWAGGDLFPAFGMPSLSVWIAMRRARGSVDRTLDRFCIHGSLERDEQGAGGRALAGRPVRPAGGAVGIMAGLEQAFGRALIFDPQPAAHQDHPLGRAVAVRRDHIAARHPEEDIGIGLRRIAMKHGDLAPRREDRRTRAPLQRGVGRRFGERQLAGGLGGEGYGHGGDRAEQSGGG